MLLSLPLFTHLANSGGSNLLIVAIGLGILLLLFWYFATEKLKRKRNIGSIIIAIVAVSCLYAITPLSKLKGGIDIVGGTSITMEVIPNEDGRNA